MLKPIPKPSRAEVILDDPAACLTRFAGRPPEPVEVIDSDITSVAASAESPRVV